MQDRGIYFHVYIFARKIISLFFFFFFFFYTDRRFM